MAQSKKSSSDRRIATLPPTVLDVSPQVARAIAYAQRTRAEFLANIRAVNDRARALESVGVLAGPVRSARSQ
jgi:hypothetical protein